MEKNSLLTSLFPDPAVRKVVCRVDSRSKGAADSPDFNTRYSLLDKDRKVLYNTGAEACFGSFRLYLSRHKTTRFLRHKPTYTNDTTGWERLRWIELGVDVGLLPEDQKPKDIVDEGLVIDLEGPKTSIGYLYMCLSYLRWLREAPRLVKNSIDLVDNAGRDLWAAVAYCHEKDIYQLEHSILPYSRGYSRMAGRNNDRNLALVIRLHQAALDPLSVDKRLMSENKTKNWAWDWQTKSVLPPLSLCVTNRWMLLSSEVYPIILCGNYDKAKKMATEIKKRSNCVNFE